MHVLIDYIKNLFRYSKSKFIMNLLFMILDGITGGIGILLLIPLLSMTGVTGQNSMNVPFLNRALLYLRQFDLSIQLLAILLLYLLLVVLESLITRKLSLLNTEIIQGYTQHLRISLYSSLLNTEWSCFIGKKKSDIANVFTNEISRIASGTIFFLRLTSQFIVAAFQIYVAFLMSLPLTFFVMVCGIAIFFYMNSTFREAKKLGESLRLINQALLGQVTEQLNGVKEVKSYGIEEAQLDAFEKITEKTRRNMLDFTKIQTKSSILYKIAAAIVISALFYVSVVFFKIEPASLLIIIYIFARLWPVFSSSQNNIQNVLVMIPSYVSLQKMMKELRSHEEKRDTFTNNAGRIKIQTSIRFEDVNFSYQNAGEFSLNNLNFEIPVKQTTAIVGRSGAGKSTIVDLLLGLLKPVSGEILADNIPISESALVSWRKCIGYVPQDPFLFNSTIRDNLLKFTPDASLEEIKEALLYSNASEFIDRLPLGLDTLIGDNGIRLSGGQRQRIVLARALLRKPEILVLDEATSSLDNESESIIQQSVEALSGKLTVVVIAHRLSTIRNADNILVLENGEIVEKGSYKELSTKENGIFKKMLGKI